MRHAKAELLGISGNQMLPAVSGLVQYVAVTFTNGNVAGDLTLSDPVTGLTLLTMTNTATNVAGPLRQAAIGVNGATLAGSDGALPVVGGVQAVWAQHNANTSIRVDVWYV